MQVGKTVMPAGRKFQVADKMIINAHYMYVWMTVFMYADFIKRILGIHQKRLLLIQNIYAVYL